DGRHLAVGTQGLAADQQWIYYVDLVASKVVHVFKDSLAPVQAVALSRDGKWLAGCGERGLVRVWDIATGENKVTLSGHTGLLQALAFSPDSKRLASGGVDKTVRIWSLPRGKNLAVLEGQTEGVLNLAWSPDGKTLASCGRELTVYLWNPNNGNL